MYFGVISVNVLRRRQRFLGASFESILKLISFCRGNSGCPLSSPTFGVSHLTYRLGSPILGGVGLGACSPPGVDTGFGVSLGIGLASGWEA